MAHPIPCKIRREMNRGVDLQKMRRKEATANIDMPQVKILFLPWISPILPKGMRNTVAANRKAVITQLNEMAFIPSSFPMAGSATFIADPPRGVRKVPSVTTSKAALLFESSFINRDVPFPLSQILSESVSSYMCALEIAMGLPFTQV